MRDIVVRQAESADARRLLELWRALSADGAAADSRYQMRADADSVMEQIIDHEWVSARGEAVALVAEVEHKIVGFMVGRVSDPHPVVTGPRVFRVTDAYVAPSQRRRGIGRALFREVEQAALMTVAGEVEVGTLANDVRAVAFWRSVGFSDWRVTLRRAARPYVP